ncbi:MAG: NAD(+) diphosphatase [Cellulomonas sp.]|nr:NAD(+) diphosphatase [Cellulomonas sp.]
MTFHTPPLARSTVDRAAHLRSDTTWLAAARADPRSRVILVRDGSGATSGAGGGAVDPWAEPVDEVRLAVLDPVAAGLGADDGCLFLGLDAGELPWFARRLPPAVDTPLTGVASDRLVHLPVPAAAEVDGLRWTSLRSIGAVLDAHDAGLAAAAVALDHWHTRHPRCPRCGAATQVTAGGWTRVCVQDSSEHYPRTDPAVIMTVTDRAGRLLLGRAVAWPERRFSTLAGFVEAGESLEGAVRREVAEETGVLVGDVTYAGSQPWPFPNSLMVGFHARALSTELTPDGSELAEARWFSHDELAAQVAGGAVVPPGRTSIARALLEDWFDGPLPVPGR